LRGRVAQLEG